MMKVFMNMYTRLRVRHSQEMDYWERTLSSSSRERQDEVSDPSCTVAKRISLSCFFPPTTTALHTPRYIPPTIQALLQ